MTWWHAVLIFIAGLWAGTINTVVGSGTLVTFPVLVALGYSPLTATTSNAIGLAPGTVSGAIGYRQELKGYWPEVVKLAVASFFGAICGTILLLKHRSFWTRRSPIATCCGRQQQIPSRR